MKKLTIILSMIATMGLFSAPAAMSSPHGSSSRGVHIGIGSGGLDIHIGRGHRHRRRAVCVARNFRGARYRARGINRRQARRRAMRQCRRDSFAPRTCRIVRCRVRGRW